MQRILVQSGSIQRAKDIKEMFEASTSHKVSACFDEKTALSLLNEQKYNFAIIDMDEFDIGQYRFLQTVRTQGHTFPILVVANKFLSPDQTTGYENLKLYFLEKPFQDNTLVGLTQKLMLKKKISQQKFRRYTTNQEAEIETLIEGAVWPTQIFNLSMGGAYCEFDVHPDISVGDIIRLKVSLDKMNSSRIMNAKVVWKTNNGYVSGKNGIGFKFVNSDEMYRQLMDKI